MKKTCVLLAIFLFACILTSFFTCTVFAEESQSGQIIALKSNGKYVGAKLYGSYFGDIEISVSIFDCDETLIDFNVNSTSLTSQQKVIADKVKSVFDELSQYASQLNRQCSPFLSTSDVYKYNVASCGQTVEISKETYQMLKIAQKMYKATGGAFNPCLFRLVDLWGFSPRFFDGSYKTHSQNYDRVYDYDNATYPLPEEKYVTTFSQKDFVSFSEESVVLFQDDEKYYVTKNVKEAEVDGQSYTQWLDLGGITKGFFCDYAQEILTNSKITCYYIDAGSSSVCFGKNYNNTNFIIPFTNPFDVTQSAFSIETSNSLISSSGSYERYYTVDGQRYCHIIDAKTGKPINGDVCGVSVVKIVCENSSAVADCLTTALSCFNGNELADFLNGDFAKDNQVEIIAFLQTTDGRKQIVTNVDAEKLQNLNKQEFAIALTNDGQWNYNGDAVAVAGENNIFLIILVGVLATAVIGTFVFCIVKSKQTALAAYGRPQKPLAKGDAIVALVIATVIVVLFVIPFNSTQNNISIVEVVDTTNGEKIFAYNVQTNKWILYDDNDRHWTCNVSKDGTTITVEMSSLDGKSNVFKITRSSNPSVQMIQASCGLSHDCIKTFGSVSSANSSIVCKPNGIKIITK